MTVTYKTIAEKLKSQKDYKTDANKDQTDLYQKTYHRGHEKSHFSVPGGCSAVT